MIRALRVVLSVFLLNLALSVALSAQPGVRPPKSKPILTDGSAGFQASLVRRFRARRRVERARAMPALLPVGLAAAPLLPSAALSSAVNAPPLVACAPPDHPPA